jgi:aspartate racemase
MRKLGLVGGISWVSTIDYYRLINTGINQRLGDLEYADLIIHSLNYGEVKRNNESGNWDANYELLKDASLHMKDAGVEAILLCANTMHFFAGKLMEETGLPLIHIAEATAVEISNKKLKTVGLLGTKFTMEMDFFKEKLAEQNIKTIVPGGNDREYIHQTIFEELGKGIIRNETREKYLNIMENLIGEGAEGIILGCTEIPLLISESDTSIPVFDTTAIHARAAVEFALR